MRKTFWLVAVVFFCASCVSTATQSVGSSVERVEPVIGNEEKPSKNELRMASRSCNEFAELRFRSNALDFSAKAQGEKYYRDCFLVGEAYRLGGMDVAANVAVMYALGKDKIRTALRAAYSHDLAWDDGEGTGSGAYSAMHLALNHPAYFSRQEYDDARDRYVASAFGKMHNAGIRDIVTRGLLRAEDLGDESVASEQLLNVYQLVPIDSDLEEDVLKTVLELSLQNGNCEMACRYAASMDEDIFQRVKSQCPVCYRRGTAQ